MTKTARPVYRLNGCKVSRDRFLKGANGLKGILSERRMRCGMLPTCWPMHSDALGVHPDQRKEAYEESVKMGVPTRFDDDGCAILTGPGHRKRYAEANGMFDRNGGFGDPSPKNL